MLDDRVRGVLARMEAEDAAERRPGSPFGERSLAVGPESGRLLFALVAPNPGCEVLEIGGSRGYSTIWLAAAARILGGRVVSLEEDAARSRPGARTSRRRGSRNGRTLVVGDAKETLPALEDGFDVVFLDAWKDDYELLFGLAREKLDPGGVDRRRQRHDERDRAGLRGGPPGRPHARLGDAADRARARGDDLLQP